MPSDSSFKSLTDEQLLWLFVNQGIDLDEKLDGMCDVCRNEVTSSIKKCSRCGKTIRDSQGLSYDFINPNFDSSKFDKMNDNDYVENSDEFISNITEVSEDEIK